jgi:hypothetical protein
VAGNNRRFSRCELTFDDVKIGAAHSATPHAHKYFTFGRFRPRHVHILKRLGFNLGWLEEDASLHEKPSTIDTIDRLPLATRPIFA